MARHFLCIGAQRAGTSWLFANLRQHPEVWIPPLKELHYFDGWLPLPLICSILDPRSFWLYKEAVTRLLWPKGDWDRSHPGWYLRCLLMPRTDRWYTSLFSGMGRVVGDLTPAYATIGETRVRRARALLPDAKIIYILRDPTERVWSQTALHFAHWWGKGMDSVGEEQIDLYLRRGRYVRHSEYLCNLAAWEQHYPPAQIGVFFYDQLAEAPAEFLAQVCRFLQVDDDGSLFPQSIQERHNASRSTDIPPHIAQTLAGQFLGQVEQLHKRFGNAYTARWLHNTLRAAGGR